MQFRPRIARLLPAFLALLIIMGIDGCASTEECVAPVGRDGLTPAQVAETGGHTGELQRWGGTLATTRNLADSTEIEVIGYPLERCGRPRTDADPVGRFILIQRGYLESADRPAGSALTGTGMITGIREAQVGDAPYRFPLLNTDNIRWWPPETAVGYTRPWISIGVGGGSGGVGGGVGVHF